MSFKYFEITVSLLVIIFLKKTYSQSLTLYKEVTTEKTKQSVIVDSCTELDDNIKGHLSCGNFTVECARFYDSKNCRGNSAEIRRESLGTKSWTFESVESIGPCIEEEKPAGQIDFCRDTFFDTHKQRNVSYTIELFEHKDFKGPHTILSLSGKCVSLPRKLKNRVSSIRMGEGSCIEFFETSVCNGTSVQIRRRRERHINLVDWGFDDQPASVSICGCSNFTHKQVHSECEHVTLYDEEDILGNSRSLTLTQCIDLNDEWEGATESLTIYKDCVQVYSHFGCNLGQEDAYENHLVNLTLKKPRNETKWSIRSLSGSNFKQFSSMIRSIGPCPEDLPRKSPLTAIYMAVGMFLCGITLAKLINCCVGRRNRKESESKTQLNTIS